MKGNSVQILYIHEPYREEQTGRKQRNDARKDVNTNKVNEVIRSPIHNQQNKESIPKDVYRKAQETADKTQNKGVCEYACV